MVAGKDDVNRAAMSAQLLRGQKALVTGANLGIGAAGPGLSDREPHHPRGLRRVRVVAYSPLSARHRPEPLAVGQ